MDYLTNLLPIKIEKTDELPHLEWSHGLTMTLPQLLANHLIALGDDNDLQKLTLTPKHINSETKVLSQASLIKLRSHAAFTNVQPVSGRLPINYQYIPSYIRDLIASVMGRIKRSQQARWATFPSWPLDLSADFIADLGKETSSLPVKRYTPVILTHDLDSPEGLQNAVRFFLDIEEAVGASSANYIVPCAWRIDHSYLGELKKRGHEVGIHGFDHSNKTPFLTPTERQKRLSAALPLIKQYDIYGYRSPSLLRTKDLLHDLKNLYCYDSSIPTSGGPFPVSNNGCASARPYQIEGIWELPLSMPRDGSLLFLGYSCQEILDTWIHCANLIAKSGGVVNLLTHCEYRFSGKPAMRDIYKRFLTYLADSGRFTFVLPKDIISTMEV
jgi:peptidoglycan/xylan/chitin deacetylase (PgdA/CDA1 family)